MKKNYMMPSINMTEVRMDTLLASQSTFDPTKKEQNITPSDEEYNGEFSNRNGGFWDDDED